MSTHEGLNGTAEEAERVAKARRDSLIERIRKLQRMTTERGACESEALQATALVDKLIREHNVDQSELSLKIDAKNMLKDTYCCIGSTRQQWHGMLRAVSRLYGTIHWFRKEEEDVLGLGFPTENVNVSFYGFPLDVAGSIATLAIVITSIDREIANLPKRLAKIKRESFELGMADRIIERLDAMQQRNYQEAKGKGALVVVKEEIVKEGFAGLGLSIGHSAKRHGPVDANSFAAGQRAGNVVALDRSVTQTNQRRIS